MVSKVKPLVNVIDLKSYIMIWTNWLPSFKCTSKKTAASIYLLFLTFRFRGVSLEMLLKLVRVFGSMIYSSLSASSSVGVDIEAEQRCDSVSFWTYISISVSWCACSYWSCFLGEKGWNVAISVMLSLKRWSAFFLPLPGVYTLINCISRQPTLGENNFLFYFLQKGRIRGQVSAGTESCSSRSFMKNFILFYF